MSDAEIKAIRDQIINLITILYPSQAMSDGEINEDEGLVRRSAMLDVMNHVSDNVYSEGDWK